ncbi:MAG: cell division protein SepF [Candidatus Methanomethylophilaceae archaeon]|nr:cell division protein SepF [Candidatus Methanomethylophilaceae archaeon]
MFFKKKKPEKKEEEKVFIDLNDYRTQSNVQSDAHVKIIEVTRSSDLKPVTDMAYRGNILVLDFSRFADGDDEKKAMARHLLKVAIDINGAFTEASERLMILSPSGLHIDKCRITHKEK